MTAVQNTPEISMDGEENGVRHYHEIGTFGLVHTIQTTNKENTQAMLLVAGLRRIRRKRTVSSAKHVIALLLSVSNKQTNRPVGRTAEIFSMARLKILLRCRVASTCRIDRVDLIEFKTVLDHTAQLSHSAEQHTLN